MKYFLLAWPIVFASCHQMKEELADDSPVLTAILYSGEPARNIQLFYFDEFGQSTPIYAESLGLAGGGQSLPLQYINQAYQGPEEILLDAGETYYLSGDFEQQKLYASVEMPPAISLVEKIGNDTITIDLDALDALELAFSWTELDNEKFSYVLKLEPMADELIAIPFDAPPTGDFSFAFNGPQEEAVAALYETALTYYGPHRLTVYAISKEFEAVYFFDPSDMRSLLKNGPDNVEGAKGFVTGVSSFSLDILVQ